MGQDNQQHNDSQQDRDVRVTEAKHDKEQNQAIHASKSDGKASYPEGISDEEKQRLQDLRNKADKTPEEQEELRNLEEPTLAA